MKIESDHLCMDCLMPLVWMQSQLINKEYSLMNIINVNWIRDIIVHYVVLIKGHDWGIPSTAILSPKFTANKKRKHHIKIFDGF